MKKIKKQKKLRPTTGKVREALFNILRGSVANARFLDLYAGTGAVGLTALQEGAAETVFVEEDKHLSRKIHDQIIKKRLSERTTVVNKSVKFYLDGAALHDNTFDIIFLDPPYHTEDVSMTLESIGESNIIKQTTIVVAEHFSQKSLDDQYGTLRKVKDYSYGDSVLTFYEKT